MKKLIYLISLTLILGLVLTGCFLSNVGQVPTSEQSELDGIIKTNGTYTGPVTLWAGQNIDVGTVSVWDDGVNLYVKYETETGVETEEKCWFIAETHLHVAISEEEIPQTKKGNPIPGQFDYSMCHDPWVTEYTYSVSLGDWEPCDTLCIAAHAVVWDTCSQSCMDVFSDGSEAFSAYGGSTCIDTSTRTGTAVFAWEHGAWIANVNPSYTLGDWIWESEYCVHPICGDVVDFEKTFSISGYPISGNLQITVDNAYEVFLNGSSINSVGLIGDWRNSNLKDVFVQSGHVMEVNTYPLTGLINGDNLFRFECANEYQNTDDIDFKTGNYEPEGTVLNNPGGLIYEAEICYYNHEETAWADGDRFVQKGNWATYFTYTIPCPEPVLLNGSFEYPDVTGLTPKWNIYLSSEVDWTVNWADSYSGAPDDALLELHGGVNNWSPLVGSQYAELDTDWQGPGGSSGEEASVAISQMVNTCDCKLYKITFSYSPRPGHDDNEITVYWDDNPTVYSANGIGLSDANWNTITIDNLPGASGETATELKFVETGTADSLGMFLDDVSVEFCVAP